MAHANQDHIRSYVLRQGRVSNAQERACRATAADVRRSPTRRSRSIWMRVFGRRAPRILEIGFGMGETTAAIAAAHPQNDYLGIEVHTPGVGGLLQADRTNAVSPICASSSTTRSRCCAT